MAILPLSQNNAFLKDTFLTRETTGKPADAAAPSRDSLDTSGGTANGDDKVSGFRKIFNEKKAEREKGEGKKDGSRETTSKEKRPEAASARRLNTEKQPQAGREAVKEAKKAPLLKDILSALIDKKKAENEKIKETAKGEKKTEHAPINLQLARTHTWRERLEILHKKEGDTSGVQALIKRVGTEKAAKKAVIIDLRDTPVKKNQTMQTTPALAVQAKKKTEPTGKTEMKKPLESKEPVEVKVFARHPAGAEALESSSRVRTDTAARTPTDFTSRLADAVKNEMVKQSGIILKNGNSGEIHLVLKPESLGSVRVKLNLEDNHIVGKIIVDNNTVKEIIRQNLGDLQTALQEKGYESAALNVFVAGEHNHSPDAEQDFASLLETDGESAPWAANEYESGGVGAYADALVNIVL